MPIIVVDTREQKPYRLKGAIRRGLKTGDYSLDGLEDSICLERKELSDIFGCVGKGRPRFERELVRMESYRYRAIVIEASLPAMLASPPEFSLVHPHAVIGSLVAWSLRHNVHVWLAGDRKHGAALTRMWLRHAWQELTEDGG